MLIGLELVAQHVLDAQETRDGLDLDCQCRRAEYHGVPAGHVSADQLAHLRIDATDDLLFKEPLGKFVDVVKGVAAQHAGALTDEVLELGAAELMVETGLHHADELADGHLAPAQPILGHDDAGEPGDQGAVEIEEGTNLRSPWAALDLGDRARQPHGPWIGLTVGRSHCAALPLGETGVGSVASIVNDAGEARPSPPRASTSSKPASKQRAHKSESVIDARSQRVVIVQ